MDYLKSVYFPENIDGICMTGYIGSTLNSEIQKREKESRGHSSVKNRSWEKLPRLFLFVPSTGTKYALRLLPLLKSKLMIFSGRSRGTTLV